MRGEGKKIEFKEILPSGERFVKTIVAFANTAGGSLIIGVRDDKQIIGIHDEELSEMMDKISNMVHDLVHPAIIPELYTLAVEERTVLVVQVYPSPLKPHFLKNIGKSEGTYIRVGATNKRADLEYILELERQRVNISFDEDICFLKDTQMAIKNVFEILHSKFDRTITYQDLVNLKMIKADKHMERITNSIPILLGIYDYVQIKCARFKGDSMDIFIDQKEFHGNIFDQVEGGDT